MPHISGALAKRANALHDQARHDRVRIELGTGGSLRGSHLVQLVGDEITRGAHVDGGELLSPPEGCETTGIGPCETVRDSDHRFVELNCPLEAEVQGSPTI